MAGRARRLAQAVRDFMNLHRKAGNPAVNDRNPDPPESPEERIARLEIRKLRLETDLIEAICGTTATASCSTPSSGP